MRSPLLFRPLWPVLFCGLGLVTPARADMGPLTDAFTSMGQSAFSADIQPGNIVVLTNTTSTSALKDFYLSPPVDEGQRQFSVDVTLLQADGTSHAGLLYGSIEEPRSYFIYTLELSDDETEPALALHFIQPGQGFETIWSSTGGGLTEGTNRLEVVEEGTRVTLFANGERRMTLTNQRFGRGRVGVVVWGTGQFQFANWAKTSPSFAPQ